jgi:hypothetical protein
LAGKGTAREVAAKTRGSKEYLNNIVKEREFRRERLECAK